ncbi:Protein DDI1-like protein 2 [Aphelenchoides bicaudatus]|nr:Protein DDI1-like protein 2 [Aphelenchoides bicaudatus]
MEPNKRPLPDQLQNLIGNLVSQIKVPEKVKKLSETERQAKLRAFTKGLHEKLSKDPHGVRAFKLNMPELANAFEEKPHDYEHFHQVYVKVETEMRKGQEADENSYEGQKFIENQIRIQAIEAQYEYAMEHMPEAFIPINLLHILLKINGVEVLAMIDSGAQSSIISAELAKRCNVYDHVDDRFFTKASGIGGISKVKGRIHACKMQIGQNMLTAPLDVLDEPRVEILLGLNFLRPNSAVIDLKRNVLTIGDVEIPFLGEAEFKAELKRLNMKGIDAPVPLDDQPSTSRGGPKPGEVQVDNEKLAQLIQIGIDANRASDALQRFNNDIQQAMQSLFDEDDKAN